jgi:hypothetical protein
LLALAIERAQWSMMPFLLIFEFGFLYVGLMSLMQHGGRLLKPVPPTLTPAGV